MNFVAFSGGKDSTALALRLAEIGEDFTLLFTPTGNELPELRAHISKIQAMTGKPLVEPPNRSLEFWMETFMALPSNRQRWCTRLVKIEPCITYLEANPGSTLSVGLRADEESRVGLYGPYATYRYPLREWGWNLALTWAYLEGRGVTVPKRTDCAWCYDQRLSEWFKLWRDHRDVWDRGEAWERQIGHAFRSPSRDTWPASMEGLRGEFEKGRKIRGYDETGEKESCRVCRA